MAEEAAENRLLSLADKACQDPDTQRTVAAALEGTFYNLMQVRVSAKTSTGVSENISGHHCVRGSRINVFVLRCVTRNLILQDFPPRGGARIICGKVASLAYE